jgi:hypothetical protein
MPDQVKGLALLDRVARLARSRDADHDKCAECIRRGKHDWRRSSGPCWAGGLGVILQPAQEASKLPAFADGCLREWRRHRSGGDRHHVPAGAAAVASRRAGSWRT